MYLCATCNNTRKSKKFICHITFSDDTAVIKYYYVLMSINTISICLSIYTILKIMRYEKELARQLRDFNVWRHNNMQWFVHKHIYIDSK